MIYATWESHPSPKCLIFLFFILSFIRSIISIDDSGGSSFALDKCAPAVLPLGLWSIRNRRKEQSPQSDGHQNTGALFRFQPSEGEKALSGEHEPGTSKDERNPLNQTSNSRSNLSTSATGGFSIISSLKEKYPARYFNQLISHFDKDLQKRTFSQRYWLDTQFYKPGGPVIVLDGGETDGEDRLPFLDSGILNILSRATGGAGIILEHRYYGKSFPFKDLSIPALKYLTTEESLADSAYFIEKAELQLHEEEGTNLYARSLPWIYYGGSYAGAKAAFMMHSYPHLVWAAIASSAVVHAEVVFWQYWEPIRKKGPQACIQPLMQIIKSVDRILLSSVSINENNRASVNSLKRLFGLGNLTSDRDFVNILSSPLGAWQARNWDDEVGSTVFDDFCNALKGNKVNATHWFDSNKEFRLILTDLQASQNHSNSQSLADESDAGGEEDRISLSSLAGYVDYVRENITTQCVDMSQDECFGTYNQEIYRKDSLDQTWRSWAWQVCNEWGFFQVSPPGASQPRLISKLINLEYSSKLCRFAFGTSVPRLPDVSKINRYGGFELSHPRLAYVDGDEDPWLYATPHSPDGLNHRNQKDDHLWLIPGGVHHWDENGLPAHHDLQGEPIEIQNVHRKEIEWVQAWVRQFKDYRHQDDDRPTSSSFIIET